MFSFCPTHLVNEASKLAVETLELVLLLALGGLGRGINPQVQRLQQVLIASHRCDTRWTGTADPRTPEAIAISGATITISGNDSLIVVPTPRRQATDGNSGATSSGAP